MRQHQEKDIWEDAQDRRHEENGTMVGVVAMAFQDGQVEITEGG